MNEAERRSIGLAYADAQGRIYYDAALSPLADGGCVRAPQLDELIPAPPGTVTAMLPQRRPLLSDGKAARKRTALAALLPSGYTRLLLPAFETNPQAPRLPLFGYTFACVLDDELYVAAMRTDEGEHWKPRYFAEGELEAAITERRAYDPGNAVLGQLGICAREYGCFTAQNVFLACGEAALPVSPKCNARCVGCISEQDADAGIPSPQKRIAYETDVDALVRIALFHLERVPDGIVSFGQGCEGEPLLRGTTIARAIERIRAHTSTGTINLNTNGSMPKVLRNLIDVGLDAVRISSSSFRPHVYAAYYRPTGYGLDDVFESIELAVGAGLRVSLNVLTHPGVTDDAAEVRAMEEFLTRVRVAMIQTRTLNIDSELYFATVGRPEDPLGMRYAIQRMRELGVKVGNFTHAAPEP